MVTKTTLEDFDEFLVIGSDGLWDELSNEEVVGLMAGWLTKFDNTNSFQAESHSSPSLPQGDSGVILSSSTSSFNLKDSPSTSPLLPSLLSPSNSSPLASPHPSTLVPSSKYPWSFRDVNPSTHLIRNALGGDSPRVGRLLALEAPLARSSRDDLSVTVLFFHRFKDQQLQSLQDEKKSRKGNRGVKETLLPMVNWLWGGRDDGDLNTLVSGLPKVDSKLRDRIGKSGKRENLEDWVGVLEEVVRRNEVEELRKPSIKSN